jgi:hypothetical protein
LELVSAFVGANLFAQWLVKLEHASF